MAGRGREESYPLMHRTVSDDSFTGLQSRVSSVSEFSDYDPNLSSSQSRDSFASPLATRSKSYPFDESDSSQSRDSFVSSQPSRTNLRSYSYDESADISHVRLDATRDSPIDQPQRPRMAPGRIPDSFRAGPPPSPSASYNLKRFSWNLSETGGSTSPIEKLSDGARNLFGGRNRSVRSSGSRKVPRHQAIPEHDEMDMGLIESASNFGRTGTRHSGIGDLQEEDEISLGVDISSFTGPLGSHDPSKLQQYSQLESEGHLTGGLGAGLKADARISSKALYSSAVSSPVDVTHRLSKPEGELSRAATLRSLGQREANRRGQVIEVVVEEDEAAHPVDLSSIGGLNAPNVDFNPNGQHLKRTTPLAMVETYYPQGNWKPISMRWPYLTTLIVISITLAVAQEYLYQKSASKVSQNLGLFTFKSPEDISTFDYFTFKYAPTIIAVTYGILWQFTDFEVKRLEAYYQLSREGGALASESINVDYVTVFNLVRPFRAFRHKHWAVAVSSIATIFAVSFVPTLQVASVVVQSSSPNDPNGLKLVIILSLWSRFLTAVLSLIATLGCILLWQLQGRHSGLVADVKGIAGIAAMATKSHVLTDFQDLDKYPPKAIHDKLKNRRYTLRNTSLVPSQLSIARDSDNEDQYIHNDKRNPHPLMLQPIITIAFIISMTLFLAFLPIVLFVRSAHVVTSNVPWILTLAAVLIKICFQTLEQDVRLMEPFYILSRRHAHPRVLTLDYTSMAFLHMPIRAFLNGHYLMALVGFGSVFAEVLTVCVTSFAGVTGADFLPPDKSLGSQGHDTSPGAGDTGDVTPLSFWISFGLSVFILLYLILVASVTLHLRRHPFLPRQPSTIASVLAYIHQSKMLWDFVGYERDNELMVRKLAEAGKTYGLGWFTGRDGKTHCGVDLEELTKGYTHLEAEDLRKAVVNPDENWQNF